MMNAKHWIKAPRDMGGAAVEFRRHFKTAKKVASATINVTAMGVYTLYLNGKRLLDNGVLTPGFTGYKNHIQYQTYDVTAALRAENDLTIAVAPGWAVGNMGYQHKVKNFCDEVAVIGEMTIRYADGTKSVINTGSTFDVYTSPVVYSDIYMGETIDLCHKPTYIGKAQHKEITSRPGACLDAIRDTFGSETVREGKLYRPALREKVFSDPLEMEKLNALTARYMGEEIRSRLANATEAQVLLDAPTLFQSGMDQKCDLIIGVLASEEDCIRRITARDGISAADAARRLAQQPSEEFYKKNCHVCLENRTDPVTFRRQAEQLLASLKKGEL